MYTKVYCVLFNDFSMPENKDIEIFLEYEEAKVFSKEKNGLIIVRNLKEELYTAEDMRNSLHEYCEHFLP